MIIVAGPNGAGKATFALEFLRNEAHCPVLVAADLIAVGLAPFHPATAAVRAARIIQNELNRHFQNRVSFSFETTLSGRGYLRSISKWQKHGYSVKLLFLQLNSVEDAIAGVAIRVRQSGHDIPEDVIRRRYSIGLANFKNLYSPKVDSWSVYDNSGTEPELIDWQENQ